jgi:hypothetical protein
MCGTCTNGAGDRSATRASASVARLHRLRRTCVATTSDPANCGGCGVPCADVCTGGVCGNQNQCQLDVCNGACVDTQTDPKNCGSCGTACAVDQLCIEAQCIDYEPAIGCMACGGCNFCQPQMCCESQSYGVICVDGPACP